MRLKSVGPWSLHFGAALRDSGEVIRGTEEVNERGPGSKDPIWCDEGLEMLGNPVGRLSSRWSATRASSPLGPARVTVIGK